MLLDSRDNITLSIFYILSSANNSIFHSWRNCEDFNIKIENVAQIQFITEVENPD